ncbi:MAG: hypothetical protein Q4G66_02975 [bacterium]|nr:hypothetical protein [bacterium]
MTCILNDETLMAYVDGELPAGQVEEVRRLLAKNPDARATVELMQKSRDLLNKAFDPVLEEPVPERLINCIRVSGQTGRNAQATTTRRACISYFRAKPALLWAAALALMVGALAAYIGNHYLHSGLVDPVPVAAADNFLDEALENTISGAVYTQDTIGADTPWREIMPRLSFLSHEQVFCREYEERTGRADTSQISYGVACRQNGHWQTIELAVQQENESQGESPQPDHYAPAIGEEESSTLDALIGRLIQGQPLDPEDEARLIKNGWQAGD